MARRLEAIKRDIRWVQRKNTHILAFKGRSAVAGQVNLDWWRPIAQDGKENLGDYLSPLILQWVLEERGIDSTAKVGRTKFLAAIGSILHMGINDCTVWGSGLQRERLPFLVRPTFKKMDIRAVRGPETKRVLEARGYSCPDMFGDPAVLMPLLYSPKPTETKQDYLVITHMDSDIPTDLSILTSDYRTFIDTVYSAKCVISSTLHGIILAESYGVPAVFLLDSASSGQLFKFRDWYASTNRPCFPMAHSVEHAKSLDPLPLPSLDAMRNGLLEAFPYDLWE